MKLYDLGKVLRLGLGIGAVPKLWLIRRNRVQKEDALLIGCKLAGDGSQK